MFLSLFSLNLNCPLQYFLHPLIFLSDVIVSIQSSFYIFFLSSCSGEGLQADFPESGPCLLVEKRQADRAHHCHRGHHRPHHRAVGHWSHSCRPVGGSSCSDQKALNTQDVPKGINTHTPLLHNLLKNMLTPLNKSLLSQIFKYFSFASGYFHGSISRHFNDINNIFKLVNL